MKKVTVLILSIVGFVLIAQPLSAVKINAIKMGSKINVLIDGKFFTSYVFASDQKYPYLFPLNGPLSGGSVTAMHSEPWPHHASLFFGCDEVNGGNYWHQSLESGRIISMNAGIVKEGGDSVVITDECIWSRPGALSPIKDTRKITITAPSSTVRQIDFEFTLDMLTDVHFMKTNHSLFSARVATDLTVQYGGTIINAEGDKNEEGTYGKRSAWIDYFGKRGNVIEGLAIMQHPSNTWYPSPWFSRNYGFISPGPMDWPENGVEIFVKKGMKLSFRYRVMVHGGDNINAKIAESFAKFINE